MLIIHIFGRCKIKQYYSTANGSLIESHISEGKIRQDFPFFRIVISETVKRTTQIENFNSFTSAIFAHT